MICETAIHGEIQKNMLNMLAAETLPLGDGWTTFMMTYTKGRSESTDLSPTPIGQLLAETQRAIGAGKAKNGLQALATEATVATLVRVPSGISCTMGYWTGNTPQTSY